MSASDPTAVRGSSSDPKLEESDPTSETSTGETAVRVDSNAETRAADMPAELGEILGGYKLESILGKGGMGCVYLGRHEILKRQAAVKVLATHLSGDENYVSRFFHEAQIVNEVNHPNIVEIIDFVHNKDPLRVAYIMEVLSGLPLSIVVRDHKLSVHQTMNLCFQMCDALVAVHSIGVVHRDLKPENVFVTEPLEADFNYVPSIKILDFGIAKKQAGGVSHQTATGAIIGTPAYMAPEQISGEGVSDKTDVYAMGEILYEMLTGERLFCGENMEIMKRKLIEEVPRLKLPESLKYRDQLHGLLAWSMAQNSARRPTMRQFARAILEFCPNMAKARGSSSATLLDPSELIKSPVPTALSNPTPMPLDTGLALKPPPTKSNKMVLVFAGLMVLVAIGYLALEFGPGAASGVSSLSPEQGKMAPVVKTSAKANEVPKKPLAPKIGKVKVTSEPEGARVIDMATDGFLGTTPLPVELTEGRDRKIRLELAGHKSKIFFARFGDIEKGFVLDKIASKTVAPSPVRPKQAPAKAEDSKKKPPPPPPKKKIDNKEGDPFSKREVPDW